MKRFIFLFFCSLFFSSVFSRSQVDTLNVFSSKMHKNVKACVILPENYSNRKHYPVVYLLHGYSDNYAKWVKAVPSIKDLSTSFQMIFVCPDGGFSSWYFDSPIDSTYQYETHIVKELVPYIDTHYSTISSRNGRAITGLSMGGHGALYLAVRNKDVFQHTGSMSGGVDLRFSTKKYDIAKRIGSIETNSAEWENRSVLNMVSSLKNNELDIIIDCGVSDFFYQINATLHRRLLALNINHDYIERPGFHNWEYWTNSIVFQLVFFDRCFNR